MAQKVEKRRARRRRLTLTIAHRRRAHHLSVVHDGADDVDCVCELADTYFAKRRVQACNCRKRTKGNPRVACGMCEIGMRDRIYEWRQEIRELQAEVRAGRPLTDKPDRQWPASKGGDKKFSVEERSLNRKGEAVGAWHAVRWYRTAADRDNAIRALRHNGYGLTRSEFRAGVDPEV